MFVNPHGSHRQIFVKPNKFVEHVKELYTREFNIYARIQYIERYSQQSKHPIGELPEDVRSRPDIHPFPAVLGNHLSEVYIRSSCKPDPPPFTGPPTIN